MSSHSKALQASVVEDDADTPSSSSNLDDGPIGAQLDFGKLVAQLIRLISAVQRIPRSEAAGISRPKALQPARVEDNARIPPVG